ncbi:MAG TPA: proline racemase family protein [Steroidobacteraceae bacterium]|nr:proline racemase family protein [Steroidobacteraceae bacterium]
MRKVREPWPGSIHVIDSHTCGEPTRLVIGGGPELGVGPLSERLQRFRERFDHYRAAIVNEPRGSDTLVGALLCKPHRSECAFGLIFFNNVGYLGMCGHGTIGAVASLAHTGDCVPGRLRIDTPVGPVDALLHEDGCIDVTNVTSFRRARGVRVPVAGLGELRGDVAWGGNWFFLTEEHAQRIELENLDALTDLASRLRRAVNASGFPEVDHVELFTAVAEDARRARAFVLCPGKAYDRSPCGTGTSAKLACLAADRKLAEGEPWIQESLIGSTFVARYRWHDEGKGEIVPTITGTAHVTGEAFLLLSATDPYRWGIPPP